MLRSLVSPSAQRVLRVSGRAVLAFAATALFISFSWEPEASSRGRPDAALHRAPLPGVDRLSVVTDDDARPRLESFARTDGTPPALHRVREEDPFAIERLGGVRANRAATIRRSTGQDAIAENVDVSTESRSPRGPP